MSTRSTISLQNSDGSIRSIYCHFDGYISHNGKLLNEHYDTIDKINALLDLGSISSLHESTECPEGHTFDRPVKGYCNAYHRDRGEDLVISTYKSRDDIYGEEYNYLFVDGQWYVRCHETYGFELLDSVIEE